MSDPLVSIIIPAFREEAVIGDVIRRIRALEIPSVEVLVVDDGSDDGTAQAAAAAGARVISHPYNIGNGAAVKSGIRAARGKVLVFMDGDGQHGPEDIPRFLAKMTRFHMVVGARGRDSESSLHRRFANFFYNSFASLVAEFPIKDLTSGFRAMRRVDALRFCDMLPNTFSYPTTSTLAFLRSGRSVCYIPIKAVRRVGKSKIRLLHDGFEFLIIIMKIAMTFSPLRIFMPTAAFLFFLGLGRYLYTYLLVGRFTNMSLLLMNSAVIIFMLGLIAEQIAALRFERGDKLFEVESPESFSEFSQFDAEGSEDVHAH